ncbi:hypothetical protein [Jeotgalibacillus terrae]|uniref:Uncharacterized protein n=1 Tax=Jeotgalibacillus terrae TaxID=587735 RepID=A0ABW5ZPH2_9BACL|nr:hypothetical protein [Jeotgalibacillus terrae]MBM7581088.1 hypothetical protein [Jeotgalibacillus terrae]
MTTIVYLKENGASQVIGEIQNVAALGVQGDPDAQEMAKIIAEGLNFLEENGIPENRELIFVREESASGHLRTYKLIKDMKYTKNPVAEFRVNRSTPGAFRVFFFESNYHGEDIIVMCRAALKQGVSNNAATRQAIKDTDQLYDLFHQDPDKYL